MTIRIGPITSDLLEIEPELLTQEETAIVPEEPQNQRFTKTPLSFVPIRTIVKSPQYQREKIRYEFAIAASSVRSLFSWNRFSRTRRDAKIHADRMALRTQEVRRQYIHWIVLNSVIHSSYKNYLNS